MPRGPHSHAHEHEAVTHEHEHGEDLHHRRHTLTTRPASRGEGIGSLALPVRGERVG